MNMFINKQRRPNLSRPSIQPASSSGAATPDPSASSASATFQQQRSKRKPVDQHEFLRSLIKCARFLCVVIQSLLLIKCIFF